jgi:two-component system phosphate regulon sensor histidine kinase PhoR
MAMKHSFRTRLLLSLWLMLLLMLLLPWAHTSRHLRQEIVADDQANAVRMLHLVHWLLTRDGTFNDAEHLQAWITQTAARLQVRITYMADGGRVIADSQIPFQDVPDLDNHANRPEIIAARSQELGMSIRYSGSVQQELLYVAQSVPRFGGIPAGVLRLAVPFSGIRDRVERLSHIFLGILAVLLLASAVASHLLSRSLKRSIGSLTGTAQAIGKGDFNQRVRVFRTRELQPLAEALNHMAERIEGQFQSISDQKQQLEGILNGMQEGVMLLDSRGKVHAINRALRNMAPSIQRIEGRRPLEVIMSPELQEACEQVLAAPSDEEIGPLTLQIELGWQRHYEVHIVRMRDRQKGSGAIVVLHDISELKRLEKVRQDFVSNVSHELRTPLTSIKGYAETLLSDTDHDPKASRSFLEVILKNANHMGKMVNELLELARLEARDQQLAVRPVNAADALSAAWKVCAPLAADKDVSLQNDLPEAGVWVMADYDQLIQVFRNLLENAIRFSPPGAPIAVSAVPHSATVTLAVRDHGPGVPKADQQRIFERFYRVDRYRSKHPGSTGLGLAICRHIIRNHGGKIWVESVTVGENTGATFYFKLPSAATEPLQTAEMPA